MSEERLVIALGGNALSEPGSRRSDVGGQAEAARQAFGDLAALIASGARILITHGNGPQVGNLLARSELSVDVRHMPPLPLDTCVADTAGGLGYTLARELRNELSQLGAEREVATVLTEVLVSSADVRPTKPIGEEFPATERPNLERRGWHVAGTASGMVRRVVASPEPLEVLELTAIRALFDLGVATIAGGGGGVPVSRTEGGDFRGVEGVVDKDLVSALLATRLDADALMILTNVAGAFLDFGEDGERAIGSVGVDELRDWQGEGRFGEGSMRPKVEAVLRFVEATGKRGVICSLDAATAGLRGEAGTQVHP